VTIEELNQLAYLEKAIKLEKDRLDTLRENAGVKSPVISDMPKAPGARDKLGEIVPNIVDQEKQIEETIQHFSDLREKLLRFINGTNFFPSAEKHLNGGGITSTRLSIKAPTSV
jgi:hypothetical protein